MAFKKSSDWKEEVAGYCPCFNKFPVVETDAFCPGNACPAKDLRDFLLRQEQPGKKDFMTALLRIGCFNRKQLIAVMCDVFKMKPNAAARQIVLATERLKKRGKKVVHDDNDNYVIQ
jgi:hypothetical protein